MGLTKQQRTERDAKRADHAAMMAAAQDEQVRFNAAVAALPKGQEPILSTFAGPYRVVSVGTDFGYYSYPADATRRDAYNGRSWCGCNDGSWADLLAQVGVARHPRFAR